MKLKLKSVVAGVLAVAQSATVAAIAATTVTIMPVTAQAQTVNPLTEMFPVLSGIDLTTQQKIQLAELASSFQTEMGKIVTSDQQGKFRTALGEGKGFGEALAAMNITPDQQKQLQGVFV